MPQFSVKLAVSADTGSTLDGQGFISTTDTLNWTITTDTPGLDPGVVCRTLQNNGLLPREGSLHPLSGVGTAKNVKVTRAAPIYFTASANYTSTPRQPTEGGDTPPWLIPGLVEGVSSQTQEVPVDTDADGEPIVNPGTGEPVEGITRPASDLAITISKSFLGISPVAITGFSNKINSDLFLGFPAGELKTGDITAEPNVYEEQQYFKVVVPILRREPYGVPSERAWWFRRELRGWIERIETAPGVFANVRAIDDFKQPTASRVRLDETGKRLAAGEPSKFEETRRHGLASFQALGIL